MYCIFIGYTNLGYEFTSRELAEKFAKTLKQDAAVVQITRNNLSTVLSTEAAEEIIRDRFGENTIINKVELAYGQYNCFSNKTVYHISYDWFSDMSGTYRGTTAYRDKLKVL